MDTPPHPMQSIIYLVIVKSIYLHPRQVFVIQHFPYTLHFPALDVTHVLLRLVIILTTYTYTTLIST